jgi:hypothetical protein
MSPWVMEEMRTVKMHDKRLDKRLKEVLSQLAAHPTASIPAACDGGSGGHKETVAAYRLFDNGGVTPEKILAPHREMTMERIRLQKRVILAQDTSEFDVTRPTQQVRGAGPMADSSRRGAFIHALHAFDDSGTPLGSAHVDLWAREEQDASAAERRQRRIQAPLEEKESHRWIDTLRQAEIVAREAPGVNIVCVADSEADIFELFVEGQQEDRQAEWIVRACQNRAIMPETAENEQEMEEAAAARLLFEAAAESKTLFTKTVTVRRRIAKVASETRGRRQSRVARQAEVAVTATRVTLRPPHRRGRKLPPVEINVVLVREINPPPGEEPIEWLLLTSLPIDTIAQVQEIIHAYCMRWMIEVFFRTLKSGCRAEERHFETLDRQLNCLAVYLIVAWRTLYVCRLSRSRPDIDCEAVFEPAEWKAIYRVVKKQMPPRKPPTLQEMVRMVAQLGGYVNKPSSDDPGPQTVWLGMQRAKDFALCWQIFGPEINNS